MARGWESKSVEDQIESAQRPLGGKPMQVTNEELETGKKRDSLLLHRTRVLNDLERCSSDRYRKTLQEGLSYLESQLTALGWQA